MDDSRHIKSKQYHNPVVSNFKWISSHMINLYERTSLKITWPTGYLWISILSTFPSCHPPSPRFQLKAPVATNRKGHSVSRTGLIAASQVRAVSNLSSRGFGVAWHVGAQKKNTEPHRRFGAHYRDSCRSTYFFFGGGGKGVAWMESQKWCDFFKIFQVITSCLIQ